MAEAPHTDTTDSNDSTASLGCSIPDIDRIVITEEQARKIQWMLARNHVIRDQTIFKRAPNYYALMTAGNANGYG